MSTVEEFSSFHVGGGAIILTSAQVARGTFYAGSRKEGSPPVALIINVQHHVGEFKVETTNLGGEESQQTVMYFALRENSEISGLVDILSLSLARIRETLQQVCSIKFIFLYICRDAPFQQILSLYELQDRPLTLLRAKTSLSTAKPVEFDRQR